MVLLMPLLLMFGSVGKRFGLANEQPEVDCQQQQ